MILSFPQPREFPEPIVGSMKPVREIIIEKKKDLKQVHLLLSVKAPSKKDMNFEAFKIFNVLLGSD